MVNTFVIAWKHPSIHHFALSSPFLPWFPDAIRGWQKNLPIMVYQLTLFAQNMVLLTLYRHFHSLLHNISIQITQKPRLKLHLNPSISPLQKFQFSIVSSFSVMMPTASIHWMKLLLIQYLPPQAVTLWFPAGNFSHKHFAYVEWFTPFSQAQKNPNSKLFKISCLIAQGERHVSVIPVSLIRCSVQLFPSLVLKHLFPGFLVMFLKMLLHFM